MKQISFVLLFAVITLAFGSIFVVSDVPVVLAQDDTTLTAVRVDAGLEDPLDSAWGQASALTVPLLPTSDRENVVAGVVFEPIPEVSLQAVYTDDTIYIRAVWADDTLNDNRRQWTFNGESWVRSDLSDDQVAYMFDITGSNQFNALGCAAACHDATETVRAHMGLALDSTDALDIWEWRATRTAAAGYAEDRWLGAEVDNPERPSGLANDANDGGGYVNNTNEDDDAPVFTYPEGVSANGPLFVSDAVEITDDMTFEAGFSVPYYLIERHAGSRGDINASSRYVRNGDGTGTWYVVMWRPFNTGNVEDTVFSLNSEYVFGVAVHNSSGGGGHAVYEDPLMLVIGE